MIKGANQKIVEGNKCLAFELVMILDVKTIRFGKAPTPCSFADA